MWAMVIMVNMFVFCIYAQVLCVHCRMAAQLTIATALCHSPTPECSKCMSLSCYVLLS
jgi:hypothetical protein